MKPLVTDDRHLIEVSCAFCWGSSSTSIIVLYLFSSSSQMIADHRWTGEQLSFFHHLLPPVGRSVGVYHFIRGSLPLGIGLVWFVSPLWWTRTTSSGKGLQVILGNESEKQHKGVQNLENWQLVKVSKVYYWKEKLTCCGLNWKMEILQIE